MHGRITRWSLALVVALVMAALGSGAALADGYEFHNVGTDDNDNGVITYVERVSHDAELQEAIDNWNELETLHNGRGPRFVEVDSEKQEELIITERDCGGYGFHEGPYPLREYREILVICTATYRFDGYNGTVEVFTHELGHDVRLKHVPCDHDAIAIMAGCGDPFRTELMPHDIEHWRKLYAPNFMGT